MFYEKKVIQRSDFWNLKNGQSWWERGHFGWIVKSQKGEISKFEPPLFGFSIFSLQKWKNVPVPLREVEAFYSFLIMFLSSSLEGFMGGQIIS